MDRSNKIKRVPRRTLLKFAGASTALPLVHSRIAGAAGKLTMGLWDHWVPEANPVLRDIVNTWGAKNHVDVQIDFIASTKMPFTQSAEAQARTGHDVLAFDQWAVQLHHEKLTPVDDVMAPLIAKYGKISKACEYLGKVDGRWMAVPVAWGAAPLPICARISLIKQIAGEDVTTWYPAMDISTPGADAWTYDKQLKLAELCHKAGYTFALGCGSNSTDANQTWGATFGAFGADLMDAKGNVTVHTDAVREAMDYVGRIAPFLPADTISFDDASNNKALLAGKSALIWNPPSAWAVGRRDAPAVAVDCWTFPNPRGKVGRLVPHRPYFWGIWQWAQNKSAARDLLAYLSQREVVEKLSIPAVGYDIPPFLSMSDLPVWAEMAPPKGTLFNYPLRPAHKAEHYTVASSAPPDLAVQIWARSIMPSMVARTVQGQNAKEVMDWAAKELEGFRR
jgi:hypothetical protein